MKTDIAKIYENQWKSLIFQGFSESEWPQVGSSGGKNGPNMLQAGTKLAQVGSKLAQVSPKLASSWPQVGPNLRPILGQVEAISI